MTSRWVSAVTAYHVVTNVTSDLWMLNNRPVRMVQCSQISRAKKKGNIYTFSLDHFTNKMWNRCIRSSIFNIHTLSHAPSLPQPWHHTPHQSSLLLSSKSGTVVRIYSLESDVYSLLPFLNEPLTITLSLTEPNYCYLNEGLMVHLCVYVCTHVCMCVFPSQSLHHLRAPVCDLTSHMAFLPKYAFTFLLSSEKPKEGRAGENHEL